MKIFNLDPYLNRAEKAYALKGQESFSYILRLSAKEKTLHRRIEIELKAAGVGIDWVDRRVDGFKQGIPGAIHFDLNTLFKRRPKIKAVRSSFLQAIEVAPNLRVAEILSSRYADCVKRHETLKEAVGVAKFVLENRNSLKGLYPRQMAHGLSTKLLTTDSVVSGLIFLELGDAANSKDLLEVLQLRSKPLSFQFFANHVRIDQALHADFLGVLTKDNLNRFDFSGIRRALIVENEETFYALRELVKSTLLVFGAGKRAYGLSDLKPVFQMPVFYSGDLDKEGYEIANFLKDVFPTLETVGMSEATLREHSTLTWSKTEPVKTLQRLSIHHSEYELTCSRGLLLEQEKLPLSIYSDFMA